jgi:putative SOS response-associated peptidase YedK
MCGRYTDSRRNKELLVRYGFQADLGFAPRYNIAPTQDASILALGADGTPEHKRARWGLLPVWTKGSTIPASLINARAETVATKPSFRHSYQKRRCLVLADGFYEWQKRPDGKQPTYIRLRDGAPFAFGGLWEEWRGDERMVESFCIVTTRPNQLCATVHDRMPLILREEDYAAWLDVKSAADTVAALLAPYPSGSMECYPVSSVVNNARNETVACVERMQEQQHSQGELKIDANETPLLL